MTNADVDTEALRRATVTVIAGGSGRHGHGSGVICSETGRVVTNAHVIAGQPQVQIELWNGRRLPARVLSRSGERDLAALNVETRGLTPARFGDSAAVHPGEWVMAIGAPYGVPGAMSRGIVHACGPVTELGWQEWIQADLRLGPGNSGGPMYSAEGRVIGINTMVAGGLALAIPGNEVLRFLDHPDESPATPPLLGVVLEPVRLHTPPRLGLRILHIDHGSPAEAASLAVGDILTGADGAGFRSPWDLRRAAHHCRGVLQLAFLRGQRSIERRATIRLNGKAD